MTTEEFSNEFDTLLNSYSDIRELGKVSSNTEFDEYEKSIFLTKAQEELVLDTYNGKNPFGDSFEKTEEIRRYLSELIKTTICIKETVSTNVGLSEFSTFFKLPEDLWFITYESVKLEDDLECMSSKTISVVPITQDEYHKIKKNPFRGVGKRRALRLDLSNDEVEIISNYNIQSYLVRYLSRPTPIILTNLPDNLSINSISERTECKLNPVLHRTILERAVKLAILSKIPNAGK